MVIGNVEQYGGTDDVQADADGSQSDTPLTCSYDDYLNRHLAPAISAGDEDKRALLDALSAERIESGKSELDLTRASLPAIMDDVRDPFERQMAEKDIAYSVDSSQVRDGCVICDKTRLNRVLLNLVSNAYKFTPEGGSVQVQLVQLDGAREGYGSYELHVKDTGIGMSEEFAHKIFDAFERERSATASGIAGTGLGMAITRNIVDMMGGMIDAVSQQGHGTEFTVALEFELQVKDLGDNQSNNPCEPQHEPMDFTGLRALLAEDQVVNRVIAVMMLEGLGFEVDVTEDGAQALVQLASCEPGRYDVVITDIQMPVMDGYELAQSIRKLDDANLARIPIVAMSANAFQEDVKASHEAGMDAHVAKPIDIGILSRTLAEALASAR